MTRIIKRYGNRKLYDVEASAYVALDDIAALIRRGATVQVMDNVTGEDITAQTLTQIVLEEGKRGRGILPSELLHDLLRRSGQVLEGGVEELTQRSPSRTTQVLQGPQVEELKELRLQLATLEGVLTQLLVPQEKDGTFASGATAICGRGHGAID